ncbi:hypothetical protein HHK36_032284 [Tetracentron sinense]|uniref:Uncharacterized protein n=1 Tax=Tetracentron sinense TaxID=13715 RepID=A0A834Y872_TETSI|nr:hypothetical protein HHK36_032284 [Tetracentron sinense]
MFTHRQIPRTIIHGKNKPLPKDAAGHLEGVYGHRDLILVAFVEANSGLPFFSLKILVRLWAVRFLGIRDSKTEERRIPRIQDSRYGIQGDNAKPNLSVTLNFLVRPNRSTGSGGEEDHPVSCKRQRSDASSLPFFLKPGSEVLEHSSMEDLDLELRLGDRPKVK